MKGTAMKVTTFCGPIGLCFHRKSWHRILLPLPAKFWPEAWRTSQIWSPPARKEPAAQLRV